MATLAQIRTGLYNALSGISGLTVSQYWPQPINVPAVLIKPMSMSERTTYADQRIITFEIVLAAAPAQSIGTDGQKTLDSFLDDSGASSIVAALEADDTLGGICAGLLISWADYGVMEIEGVQYYAARFTVTVEP